MTDFTMYVDGVTEQFGADTLRIPATYDPVLLSGLEVAIALELSDSVVLEEAQVCEWLKDGVVVARARLS